MGFGGEMGEEAKDGEAESIQNPNSNRITETQFLSWKRQKVSSSILHVNGIRDYKVVNRKVYVVNQLSY